MFSFQPLGLRNYIFLLLFLPFKAKNLRRWKSASCFSETFSSCWKVSSSSIFQLAGLDLRPAPTSSLLTSSIWTPPHLWAPAHSSSISIIHQTNKHLSPPEHTFNGGFICFKTLPDCSCWQTRHTPKSSAQSYTNQLMRSLIYLFVCLFVFVYWSVQNHHVSVSKSKKKRN